MLYPAQPRAKKMGAKTKRILKSNNYSEMIYYCRQLIVTSNIYGYEQSNIGTPL